MRNCTRFHTVSRSIFNFRNRGFATKSTAYDPKIVNEAINPRPGKLYLTIPRLFALASAMLAIPVVATLYDNQVFKKELEKRNEPGFRY